ncbi:GNAT family N-acetyltransferase [Streptomyces sp. NRRL F-5123]|uniref:GNAT family N-acetyltransferase n=1 Tax=Streptomyces sp. NRRL F-5123 TaxID=1463856 RepID=UPI000694676C|nr:GNAT family N-acetyltransferase [Streptomyces sp. NRRL F-5123]
METVEQDALVIGLVGADEVEELLARPALPALDVIRIADGDGRPGAVELPPPGFVARPAWVNWVARAGAGEEEWLAGLSGGERRRVRVARRFAEREGLDVRVREGLDPEFLDAFLSVYDAQIAAMPRGRNFARRHADRLLAARGELLTVAAYAGPDLVAGSIWWVRPRESVLQMRFSAATAASRAGGSLRVVYAAAFQAARERELAYLSLGNDPSLFGHVVQVGLYAFKSRLGFVPVPSGALDPHLHYEFVDAFVSLRSLENPSLVLPWGPYRGRPLPWPGTLAEAEASPLPPLELTDGDGGDGAPGGQPSGAHGRLPVPSVRRPGGS